MASWKSLGVLCSNITLDELSVSQLQAFPTCATSSHVATWHENGCGRLFHTLAVLFLLAREHVVLSFSQGKHVALHNSESIY